MKTLVKVLSTVVLVASVADAFAQGSVYFANATSAYGTNMPNHLLRFGNFTPWPNQLVTSNHAGVNLSGLRAQLFYGASTLSSPGSLTAVTDAPATFRPSTSANAGSWIGGTRTLFGFLPGATVAMNVIAWDSSVIADPLEAMARQGELLFGQSGVFTYTIPESSSPPRFYLPANQLPFFVDIVPEPGTFALTGLGAAALLMLRRRKLGARRLGGLRTTLAPQEKKQETITHQTYMKTFVKLLSTVVLVAFVADAFAQGQVNFANATSAYGTNMPNHLLRFGNFTPWPNQLVTSNHAGVNLSGLRAQLFYGASTLSSPGSLTPVTDAPATFRSSTSVNAGSWFGGFRSLIGFLPLDTVALNVIVWDSSVIADPLEAMAHQGELLFGQSGLFTYRIPDPGSPPTSYLMRNQLPFFVDIVPEPGTFALTGLSAAALLILRRRRDDRG